MSNNRIANGVLAALPIRRHLIHSFNIAFVVLGMGIAAAAPDQHCSATGICKQQPPGMQRPAGAIASAVEAAQKVEQAAADIARRAKANRERGIHGGIERAEYEERCPADQVVVGFEGTTTPQRLQQIRLICAPVRQGGRLGDRAVAGERIGGPVGSRTQAQCPDDNSAMVGFRVGLTGKDGEASTVVRRIALRCGLLEPPHRQLQVDRSVGPQTASPVAVDGGACTGAKPMVVGVRGQHRSEINSFGVICGAMPQPLPAPPPSTGVCIPGALATVTITSPGVNRLNVRASPGGMVLATIENGSRVSVVGVCGPERAAGIAAPSGGWAGSDWCQIDKPVIGCVSSQYLFFGTVGISPSPPQADSTAARESSQLEALALAASVAVSDPHKGLSPASSAASADMPSSAARDAAMEPRVELVQYYSTSPMGGAKLQGLHSIMPKPIIDYGKSGLPKARLKADVVVRENPWEGNVVASLRAGTLVVVQYRAAVPQYGPWAQIALPGKQTLGWVDDRFLDFARKDERIDFGRGVLP